MANEKVSISAILISLIAIVFFLYVAWLMFQSNDWLKAIGMLSVCGLFLVNFLNLLLSKRSISYTWQWIFIIIAIVLWLLHSILFGKISNII